MTEETQLNQQVEDQTAVAESITTDEVVDYEKKYYEEVKQDNLLLKEPSYKDLTGKDCIVKTKYLSGKDVELSRKFSQRMFYLQKQSHMIKNFSGLKKIFRRFSLFGSFSWL